MSTYTCICKCTFYILVTTEGQIACGSLKLCDISCIVCNYDLQITLYYVLSLYIVCT